MRVCQVLAGNEDGGLEKHTIELSRELQKQGLDVTVIAHQKFSDDFTTIHFIPLDLSKGRNNLIILFQLYKIFKEEKFDIIHTQANKATAMLGKLKPFLRSKIVSTLHNYKKNLKAFLKSDAVITVSDRIGEKLNISNKMTVYNGVKIENDNDVDLYEKFNIPKDKFIICSVGRLVEAKGFDLLIESMQYVDQNIYLLLIGDGPEERKLESLAQKANVKNRINFVGNIENRLTKSIIKSSDLLVISSRREGFSYVFAESLRLDTPIVSTDVADIKKFIPKKYIAAFDPKFLAEKINDFKLNYNQNIVEYQENFDRANNTFTIENMAEQTIDVYKKVMH
jgi:glycosyltransferase involved in cell wall biosynthesis